MANLQERRNKDGKLISYSIRVHKGRDALGNQLKPYITTFEVTPSWTESSALKKAQAFAAIFEKQCKEGVESDNKQTFSDYAGYTIKLKEQCGVKHSTIFRYKQLLKRINDFLGHIKIKDIRAQKLNDFYTYLSEKDLNLRNGKKLSAKTVLEYHRLISTILEQAFKEGLIPYNPARRAEVPKVKKKEVNFFQPEDLEKIKIAMQNEPIKYRTLIHLFIITGARRGEISGLKWDSINFENKTIHIKNNVLYSAERGVYESTPKTKKSIRFISIPEETVKLLKEYKKWQEGQIEYFQGYYVDKWLGSSPWALIFLTVMGIGAAYKNAFITFSRYMKDDTKEKDDGKKN